LTANVRPLGGQLGGQNFALSPAQIVAKQIMFDRFIGVSQNH
jgi:hypothetical protein